MHEADVALTDFALAVECAIFVVWILRRLAANSYRRWVVTLFASISAGALCGGFTHAYFWDESTPGNRVLWIATMLSIGVSALACWNLSAEVLDRRWLWLRIFAAIEFLAYASLVLAGMHAYRFVIFEYVPAAVFLLICCSLAFARGRRNLAWTIVGLLLTFVAAAVQLLHVSALGISHNALYHVMQAVALFAIFIGLLRTRVSTTACSSEV